MRPRNETDAAAGLILYTATLVVELPGAYLRATLAMLVWRAIGSPGIGGDSLGWIVGLLPLAWSVSAFAWSGRGFWWRVRTGARRPSARERAWLDDALALLDDDARRVRWFVLDEPALDAVVRGRTVMVTRGLLQSDELAAVLAHELGHLDSLDGRLTESLNRVALQPPWTRTRAREEEPPAIYVERTLVQAFMRLLFMPVRILFRVVVFLATGRLGQFALGPLWAAHWRGREYAADDHAAALGHADELADFLELHALFFDLPVPFAWLAERSHPPVELRLERLRDGRDPASLLEGNVLIDDAQVPL